jgi:hypothetical protein
VLHEACNEGLDGLVELLAGHVDPALIEAAVPPEQLFSFVHEVPTVVFCAAHNGHVNALEHLLAIPEFRKSLKKTFMGLTALETAIVTRHDDCIYALAEVMGINESTLPTIAGSAETSSSNDTFESEN